MSAGPPAKIIENELCLSAAQTLILFGVSAQTLSEWVKKGMPQAKRGWYPLKKILAWRGMITGAGIEDRNVELQRRKLEVEIALKGAQQELATLKTGITGGKFIEREVITEEYRRFFILLKRAMMAIPKRLAGIVSAYVEPVEARRLEKELDDTVRKALESFVKGGVIDG